MYFFRFLGLNYIVYTYIIFIRFCGVHPMNILIWVEPKMSTSNWYHGLEEGIIAGLNARRLKAQFVSIEKPEDVPEKDTVIILAGETYEWYNRMLTFTADNQIMSCVVGCEFPMYSDITVTSDYAQVAYNMVQYLYDAGRHRIAMFGVNPSSPHDNLRLKIFLQAVKDLGLESSEEDIYFTSGDIAECANNFCKNIHKYNAILGANDLYAFFAMIEAKKAGIRIPEELYIAGFGNTMISRVAKPPITSATINMYDIGYQAISAIHLLTTNDNLLELSIKNNDTYFARESTECRPFSNKYKRHSNTQSHLSSMFATGKTISSFEDEKFMNVINYEILLRDIDQVDYSIIRCIIEKNYSKRSRLSEDCFLSDTALDYRLKKLYHRFNVKSYAELYYNLMEMSEFIDFTKISPDVCE